MSHTASATDQGQPNLLKTLEQRLRQRQAEISERRSGTRYPLNTGVTFAVESEDGSHRSISEAWALDFSRGGMLLLAERALAVDHELVVDFGSELWDQFSARVNVVHCAKLVGSIFRVGVRFVP